MIVIQHDDYTDKIEYTMMLTHYDKVIIEAALQLLAADEDGMFGPFAAHAGTLFMNIP